MKKLLLYYTCLLIAIVLTVLLLIALIIEICLGSWKIVQLLISICLAKTVLWAVLILNRPTKQEIIKALLEEESRLDIKEIKRKIDSCEKKVKDLHNNYEKCLNILDKEEKEDV